MEKNKILRKLVIKTLWLIRVRTYLNLGLTLLGLIIVSRIAYGLVYGPVSDALANTFGLAFWSVIGSNSALSMIETSLERQIGRMVPEVLPDRFESQGQTDNPDTETTTPGSENNTIL